MPHSGLTAGRLLVYCVYQVNRDTGLVLSLGMQAVVFHWCSGWIGAEHAWRDGGVMQVIKVRYTSSCTWVREESVEVSR